MTTVMQVGGFVLLVLVAILVVIWRKVHAFVTALITEKTDAWRRYDEKCLTLARVREDADDKLDSLVNQLEALQLKASERLGILKASNDRLRVEFDEALRLKLDAEKERDHACAERDCARETLTEKANVVQKCQAACDFAVRKLESRKFVDDQGALLTHTQAFAKLKKVAEGKMNGGA